MKTERLEYLGRIYERLNNLIDFLDLHACDSKHQFDEFMAYYTNLDVDLSENEIFIDRLDSLHLKLRYLIEELKFIRNLAYGNNDE